jgi:predicted enzyme related to lactoylglutathione lyase
VVVPATTLPDGDTMAVLRDPTGVTFGLIFRPS